MPPEIKVTKDRILETAYAMTREEGFENVTARRLAARLECSTQPIFRAYKNMDELKADIAELATDAFTGVINDSFNDRRPLHALVMNYLKFALREKNLYRMMFMDVDSEGSAFSDIFGDPGFDQVLMRMDDMDAFSLMERRLLFMQSWIFVHGMASMTVTGDLSLSESDLEDLLNTTLSQLMS